ncbi:MAG: formate dehydrogenase accessory protein FdhE [Anaerolineaceae bacterium]|nr:formate dehydrogenase accessory protein FdhE [Anaerolineaceae bacterium]
MIDTQRFEKAIQQLEEAKDREPELFSYYQFYQDIFRLQAEAIATIGEELVMADKKTLKQRAQQGLSQLSFSDLPIKPARFTEQALKLANTLLEHQGGDENELSLADVDWVSLARERFENGRCDAAPDLIELAAELATAPYLEWASEQTMPHIFKIPWIKGSCPVCDGEPNFAYLEGEVESRWLVCSRCRAVWQHNRVECPFCENKESAKLKYYPAGKEKAHRLYVCDVCHRYLKAVDLRVAGMDSVNMVEPVLTWSLDTAARDIGYV